MENSLLYYIQDIAEINSISDDLNSLNHNYEFIYFVDTFDILEYIYPSQYTFKSIERFNLYASHAKSYQMLFLREKYKAIRLQEYESELESIKRKFTDVLGEPKGIEGLIEELKTRYVRAKKGNNYVAREKFYKNYFCSIIAIATGVLNANNIKRYANLVEQDMAKEKIQDRNKISDLTWVNSRMNQTTYNIERVKEIFKNFCEEVKYLLSSLDRKNRMIYLSNTYRDIQVIDRLNTLNKRFSSKDSTTFLRCRFISSTPRKTMILKKVCYEYYSSNFQFRGVKTDIIRTNQQYFLTTLSIQLRNDGTNDDQSMSLIESCKRAIKANNNLKSTEQEESVIEDIEKAISKNRNDLYNVCLLYTSPSPRDS